MRLHFENWNENMFIILAKLLDEQFNSKTTKVKKTFFHTNCEALKRQKWWTSLFSSIFQRSNLWSKANPNMSHKYP